MRLSHLSILVVVSVIFLVTVPGIADAYGAFRVSGDVTLHDRDQNEIDVVYYGIEACAYDGDTLLKTSNNEDACSDVARGSYKINNVVNAAISGSEKFKLTVKFRTNSDTVSSVSDKTGKFYSITGPDKLNQSNYASARMKAFTINTAAFKLDVGDVKGKQVIHGAFLIAGDITKMWDYIYDINREKVSKVKVSFPFTTASGDGNCTGHYDRVVRV